MKIWIKIISILEIVGGIFGIAFMIWLVVTNPDKIFAIFIAIFSIGIYTLSLVAGIALWRGRKFGRTTSIIVQVIQLVKIISPLIIFKFSFGLDIWVHFLLAAGGSDAGFNFVVLAANELFFDKSVAASGFGISIVSFVFLIILLSYNPYIRVKEVLPNSATIDRSSERRA